MGEKTLLKLHDIKHIELKTCYYCKFRLKCIKGELLVKLYSDYINGERITYCLFYLGKTVIRIFRSPHSVLLSV